MINNIYNVKQVYALADLFAALVEYRSKRNVLSKGTSSNSFMAETGILISDWTAYEHGLLLHQLINLKADLKMLDFHKAI